MCEISTDERCFDANFFYEFFLYREGMGYCIIIRLVIDIDEHGWLFGKRAYTWKLWRLVSLGYDIV